MIPRSVRFSPRSETRRLDGGPDLVLLGRLIWTELPMLAAINLGFCLGASIVLMIAMAIPPLAPLAAAVLLGPLWAGAIASALRIADGDAGGIAVLMADTCRHARTGLRLALPPAFVATVLLGTASLFAAAGRPAWMFAPIALDLVVVSVLALGSIWVVPIGVSAPFRGRRRWIEAFATGGRHPAATLGIAAIGVLATLSAVRIGPFGALILPGPICLLIAATYRSIAAGPET